MRKMKTRILSLVLALALLFSMIPLGIFAEGDEPASDGRGTGEYANAEGVLTYDNEDGGYLTVPADDFYFDVANPSTSPDTITVFELDIKMSGLASTDWHTCFIIRNAAGDNITYESARTTFSTIDGKVYISDSYANTNIDNTRAEIVADAWTNVRLVIDNETHMAEMFVNNVSVATWAQGIADTQAIAKILFYSRADVAAYIDNAYAATLYKPGMEPDPDEPGVDPAPEPEPDPVVDTIGAGQFVNHADTKTYDDQPKGFLEAGGSLTYDYDVEDGTLGARDIFIYEYDFRWTAFGYNTQYDPDQGSYIMFYKTGNGVNDSGGRLCIKFKSADDNYAYLTTIGTTLVDSDSDGKYDNALYTFSKNAWYNVRFVVNEVANSSNNTFTPTIYVYVNGIMIDANGTGAGYGYAQHYDKPVADRDAWAPYHFSMSARSGFTFDIDNFYAGSVLSGEKGTGEYAEAWGVIEDETSQRNSVNHAVIDSSEASEGEIFVYETDIAVNGANPKAQYDKFWVGYISLHDVNDNLMTTQSGRIGICSDGARVVLCGNATSGNFELNEDGSIKGAFVEFKPWEWHNLKIVVRYNGTAGEYGRRVEVYFDGELVYDAWDGNATTAPEFGYVTITSRDAAMYYSVDNTYLSAFATAATVNGKAYESVDAAIAAANDGDTIKVLESVVEGDEYVVPDGKMIYLELAGDNDESYLFAREMQGNTYVVVENTYFEFLGGSLRYENAVDGKANIRFGYQFTNAFDFANGMWAWEYTLGNNPADSLEGENYNAENRNSNIVFTNVGVASYEKAITVRLGFVVEIDGESYVVFDVARTYTVLGVAEALLESDSASQESKAYAQSIVDAYAAYVESLNPQE